MCCDGGGSDFGLGAAAPLWACACSMSVQILEATLKGIKCPCSDTCQSTTSDSGVSPEVTEAALRFIWQANSQGTCFAPYKWVFHSSAGSIGLRDRLALRVSTCSCGECRTNKWRRVAACFTSLSELQHDVEDVLLEDMCINL